MKKNLAQFLFNPIFDSSFEFRFSIYQIHCYFRPAFAWDLSKRMWLMNFTVWIAFSPAVNFCVYIFAALVLRFFYTSKEEEKETCALYWPKTQMELYVNMLFLQYIIICIQNFL